MKAEDCKEIHEKSQLNFRALSTSALVVLGLEVWLSTPMRLQIAPSHLDWVFKKWVFQNFRPTASEGGITEPTDSDFTISHSF